MTYSAANRLATYNGQAVQFDADGNLLFGPLAGEMANFSFDSRNRLIQAGETSYRYDTENQRTGVNQTSYVVNSQPALSQVLVKDENGVKTFYVYGLGLLGDEKDGEYRSYHFDFRGSTDNAGKVVQRFQYGPYGELLKGEASVTPFLFNGKFGVMSEGNGLYYMRARFYSAEMKRFVNMDVLLGSVGEGQSLNRYAFVTGQPVSLVDPFGLQAPIGEYYGDPVARITAEDLTAMIAEYEEHGDNIVKHIVEAAKQQVGSSQWSYYGSVGGLCWFRSKSNKCNKFVYDILTEAGVPVPTIRGRFNHCPPTASDWASPMVEIQGWEIVIGLPQPEDVVAVQHEYSDATGHVGIVSGEKTTISQSSETHKVVENDWGFRGDEGIVVFRRCTCLNP
ncbi:MAG: hypothetical protein BWK78_07615 [Thiotrichaceae bacterium IS1]|nr:MAG: hypothetical protein BWK78_07615 [Thiotrichaceae bacterium IS1]